MAVHLFGELAAHESFLMGTFFVWFIPGTSGDCSAMPLNDCEKTNAFDMMVWAQAVLTDSLPLSAPHVDQQRPSRKIHSAVAQPSVRGLLFLVRGVRGFRA